MKNVEEARLDLAQLVVLEVVWPDSQWREAARDLLGAMEADERRRLEATADLMQERDEATRRADEWEHRAGDWMVRCEDAEAEAEALRKQMAAASEGEAMP